MIWIRELDEKLRIQEVSKDAGHSKWADWFAVVDVYGVDGTRSEIVEGPRCKVKQLPRFQISELYRDLEERNAHEKWSLAIKGARDTIRLHCIMIAPQMLPES